MRAFAVVNRTGSVGKTTTAVHLAAGWARAGRRVLLIDTDALLSSSWNRVQKVLT